MRPWKIKWSISKEVQMPLNIREDVESLLMKKIKIKPAINVLSVFATITIGCKSYKH